MTVRAGRTQACGGDLARLLDLKDNAHYGVFYLSEAKARQAVKWAQRMVAAAGTAVLG